MPSTDIVEDQDTRTIDLDLRFTHPMEQGPTMNMARPRQIAALVGGKRIDLAGRLKPRKVDGKSAFTCSLPTTTPGDYVVYVEPEPYWEAAEQKMIVHYTKVVIDVLGAEKGWDALVGLPVEIEPLVRPYGLWTGNTFRGIVQLSRQARAVCPRGSRVLQRGPAGEAAARCVRHASRQDRPQRRVFLYDAPGRLVGLRGIGYRRREDEEPGRQAGRRGIGRADVGQSGRYAGRSEVVRCISGEGILTATPAGQGVLLAGTVAAAAGTMIGLRRLDEEQIPKAAVLGSAFFVASAIQVPMGGSSVHLVLSGLMGLVLGWAIFPTVLVGLILQVAFFSIAGPTVLGINTLIMALPGVICHYLFRSAVCSNRRWVVFASGFRCRVDGASSLAPCCRRRRWCWPASRLSCWPRDFSRPIFRSP